MTEVCREFGISRKTGYKIFNRYKEHGLQALSDRSRRPVRYANQLPPPVESLIVECKRGKPHWGARKSRELLVRRLDGDIRVPAKSTIHAVLDRHGLVKRRGRRRNRANGTPLSPGVAPNDLWCADFKSLSLRRQGASSSSATGAIATPHGHRPHLALCVDVRGPRIDPRGPRRHRL
jgi:transposase